MNYNRSIQELIKDLNYYTKCYDEGAPVITDEAWDDLYFQLAELERATGIIYPNSPTQTINYEVVNSLTKVEHNHKMLSLDKTKNWDDFKNYFNGKSAICMPKLDGLTCSLTYENGELIRAETRGNGIVGEDITHNARVVASIPQHIGYPKKLVVDGEILCTAKDFEQYSDLYANPRNFASGSIRLLDANECAHRNLTFVVWNIIDGLNSFTEFDDKIDACAKLGFLTVPYFYLEYTADIITSVKNIATSLGYPIDGIVGRFNDTEYGKTLGETEHHSRAAYAFKFYDEEYETRLLNIEWSMGRTGVLTPIVVFEPIDTGESIIERASVHNLSILYELSGGGARVGDLLTVYKANQIIPQVSNWEHCNNGKLIGLIDICPICGQPISEVTSNSGVRNFVCENSACEGKLINRLEHFCGKTGLDIKGISKATLEKLIDWQWLNSLKDIFALKTYRSDWIQKPGFGAKSVDKILDNIENAYQTTTLQQFIVALGIPMIGVAQSKSLVQKFKTWPEFYDAIVNKYDFTTIDGIGEVRAEQILKFDYTIANLLAPDFILVNKLEEKNNEIIKSSQPCKNLTFCITGKLQHFSNRDAFIAEIEQLGGKVSSSVSSKTNYLINNDITSDSSKNKKAKELNIPIISEEQWINSFKTCDIDF